MNGIGRFRGVPLGAFALVASCFGRQQALSNESLLQYASSAYDKGAYGESHQVLGRLNGTEVVADFVCGDVCPDYTIRIVHFDVEPGEACAAIDGVERSVVVPMAIAVTERAFCFPKVLVENWDAYVR